MPADRADSFDTFDTLEPSDSFDSFDSLDALDPFDTLDPLDAFALGTPATAQSEVDFLAPSPSSIQLADSAVYRQGAAVALALLAGPAVCAIVAVVIAALTGALPVWLPFALLLWLPVLALTWGLLTIVRVTPTSLACGRPLGRWREVPFAEVERLERRGLRLMAYARRGRPLSFTPLLLRQGMQLERRLLLSLPLSALSSELRTEALTLANGGAAQPGEGDISGILTVRPRMAWPALAGGVALVALALGVSALLGMAAPLSLALAVLCGALALAAAGVCLWSIQEIFVSEKGLIIHYHALRRRRIIFWASLNVVEYTPGGVALLCRSRTGARMAICIGPGLLNTRQAQLMRGFIDYYCEAPVVPLGARRDR